MLKSLYNTHRLMYIDFMIMEMDGDENEKDESIKEYISEILTDGIDEIILRNVGTDFD